MKRRMKRRSRAVVTSDPTVGRFVSQILTSLKRSKEQIKVTHSTGQRTQTAESCS